MTILKNTVQIQAAPERVWDALTALDALHEYDPGIARSVLRTDRRSGLGADRHCDLRAGGWFRERVTVWEPVQAFELTLYECTLPVLRLRHHYRLRPESGGTRVDQTQEYTLKYGPLGVALDALVVRRTWDAGIKTFFAGLKAYVEAGPTR